MEAQDFEPFDRIARRRARDRAAAGSGKHHPLLLHVADELAARAELAGAVPAGPQLRVGLLLPPQAHEVGCDPGFALARAFSGVQCDEDRLPFGDASFARITSFMVLHGVNDLPGALVLFRRALRSGGRFLAALPAGYSLAPVREAFLLADLAAGRGVAARTGPTVDPAEAAGLLQRAGFAEPVAEMDTLVVRVPNLLTLARDLRAVGDTGWLAARQRGLMTPRRWAAAEAMFVEAADPDGKVDVAVQILMLSGKAP